MFNGLKICSGHVKWQFEEKEIDITIEKAYFSSKDRTANLIRIEAGESFNTEKVYYYTYEGELLALYDLVCGIIKWKNQDKEIIITIEKLKQVGYFPNEHRIMVLCGDKQQELRGYSIEGKQLFSKIFLENFKMLYFTKINDAIAVVCDCDEKEADEYGRFRYNYIVNVNTGELEKYGLAY